MIQKITFFFIVVFLNLLNSYTTAKSNYSIEFNKEDSIQIKELINLGKNYKHNKPDSALFYYNLALEKAQLFKSDKFISECFNHIGGIYFYMGSYHEALSYALKSLDLAKKCKNTQAIADAYNNIGILYTFVNNPGKAIENINKSIELFKQLNEDIKIAACYNNIGHIYMDQGNNEKALEYFNHYLNVNTNDKSTIALTHSHIGNIYYKTGNTKKALEFINNAYKIFTELNDLHGQSHVLSLLSTIYLTTNPQKALEYAKENLKIAYTLNNLSLKYSAYYNNAKAYEHLNNYQHAFKYHVLYKEISDSLLNTDNARVLAELQTKYEFETKQKTIELLEQENELKQFDLIRQKYIRNVFILISSILILVIAFTIYRFIIKQKANKILIYYLKCII